MSPAATSRARTSDLPGLEVARWTRPWQPLLKGDDATRAWRAIEDVAVALEHWPAGVDLPANLASGAAGLALFYSYLAEAAADDHWADVAEGYLGDMIDAVPRLAGWPSLFSGFTGVAWTLEHLRGRLLEDDGGDGASREIDRSLLALLEQGTWPGDYDLINGLVGFGVYALEVLPRPAARECLGLLLDRLEELAEEGPAGVTWHTRPELLPSHQRRVFPAGCHNLGLAHGVPAIAAFLGALGAAGVEPARTRRLLEPAVAWLLAQQLDAEAGTCFPHSIAAGVEPRPSRLAWCYGDPGVAMALLHAARLAGDGDWRRAARRVALSAASRPEADSGIQDAGLCHGSAGLGHLFARFHQATGEARAARAARFWYRHALDMRRPGEGVGGYLAYGGPAGEKPAWREARGLLEGAAGIALALLAAVSPVEPAWDRVLMTSVRPVSGLGSDEVG